MELLSVSGVEFRYGEIEALRGVDLDIASGEIVGVLGANGAGKTTLMKVLVGLLRPRRGQVRLDGLDVTDCAAHRRVRDGVSLVPEGRQLFSRLTVEDNLILGAWGIPRARQRVSELLETFPLLETRRRQVAGTMSGGEQQLLALARALVRKPRLLLLDEPSLGLAPIAIETVFRTVRRVNREGVSVLLVEQNTSAALAVVNRAYVLERGRVAFSGTAGEIRGDARLRKAYLGG